MAGQYGKYQSVFDSFIAENPGDEGRFMSAYDLSPEDLAAGGATYIPPSTSSIMDYEINSTSQSRTTAPNNNDTLSPGAFPSYDAWLEDFLVRNPGDEGRARAAYDSGRTGSGPDAQAGSGSSGGSGGSGGGGQAQAPIDMDAIMALINNLNAQQGEPNPVSDPQQIPIIEVPGVDLSPGIDNALLDILNGGGENDAAITAAIEQLLARTQGGGVNSERLTQRNLTAAENFGIAQNNAMDTVRSQLANDGMNSLPGVPQGAETAGMRRSLERLSVPFAQELRENNIRESELADAQELQALQLATGWSGQQATRVLQAAAAGTDRQRILSEIALGTLDRNITWNQFMAEFGLDREQVMAEIQAGKLNRIGQILAQFLALTAQSRQGYIGND